MIGYHKDSMKKKKNGGRKTRVYIQSKDQEGTVTGECVEVRGILLMCV